MSGPIPCSSCGQPVPPGRLACPSCGALVASVSRIDAERVLDAEAGADAGPGPAAGAGAEGAG
ncbi:MAG: hypothetical protein L0227_17810, partial [Chloroflexi bacterium]|nr:hypothetical protein [Chloroflexota bacterium]